MNLTAFLEVTKYRILGDFAHDNDVLGHYGILAVPSNHLSDTDTRLTRNVTLYMGPWGKCRCEQVTLSSTVQWWCISLGLTLYAKHNTEEMVARC